MKTVESAPTSAPPYGSARAALIAALVGAGVGLMLVRLGSGHTPTSSRFAERPEFEVWTWVLAAALAAAAALAVVIWPTVRCLGQATGRRAVIQAMVVSVAVLLLGAAFGPRPVSPGGHLWLLAPRLSVASFIGGVLITPAFVGLLLIHTRLSAMGREAATNLGNTEVDRAIGGLLWIRAALQRLLVTFAVLVTGSTLAAGALRNALLADGALADKFPLSGILAYGGLQTALCALLFVPAYVAWQERVATLGDHLLPMPKDRLPSHEWYQARTDFDAFFSARSTAGSVLAAAFGILAPLAGSLVTVLVGTHLSLWCFKIMVRLVSRGAISPRPAVLGTGA